MSESELRTLIRQLQGALDGRSVRVGSTSVTWPGGTPDADPTTVTHDLPVLPRSVQLTPIASRNVVWDVENVTDTTFDVVVETRDGTSPAAATERFFYWEVIG